MFAAEAHDDLWFFIVDANFDVMAIGAAQNGVVQGEGSVGGQYGVPFRGIDFNERMRHAHAVAIRDIQIRFRAGDQYDRADEQYWPACYHIPMMY